MLVWILGMAMGLGGAYYLVSSNAKAIRSQQDIGTDPLTWLEEATGVRPSEHEDIRLLLVAGTVGGNIATANRQCLVVATRDFLIVQAHVPTPLGPPRVILRRADVSSLRCSRRGLVSDGEGRFAVFSRPHEALVGMLQQTGWLRLPPDRDDETA